MPDWPMTPRAKSHVWVTYSPVTHLPSDERVTVTLVRTEQRKHSTFKQRRLRALTFSHVVHHVSNDELDTKMTFAATECFGLEMWLYMQLFTM